MTGVRTLGRTLLALAAALALLLGLPASAARAAVDPATVDRAAVDRAAVDRAAVDHAAVDHAAGDRAAGQERILSFTADYAVGRDGSVDVTETLVWQFASTQSHGIKRYLTTEQGYQDSSTQHRVYPVSHVTASSPTGAAAEVDVSRSGASTVIRVGSPTRTVPDLRETYVVKYHLAHVLNGFADHAELYWNVTGSQTAVPTDRVDVTVHGPAPVTRAACYYGADKSGTACTSSAGSPARFSAAHLSPYQQVTVVAAFPTTAIADTTPALVAGGTDSSGGFSKDPGSSLSPQTARVVSLLTYGGGIALPVLAAALMGLLVWKRGRDERYAGLTPGLSPVAGATATVVRGRAGPVAVAFTPPKGVRPGLVGTILDEEANTLDVSATVVDLAVRGHLRIEEARTPGVIDHTDWVLTRLPAPEGDDLLDYERIVLDGLFATGSPVTLSALKNHFSGALASAQGSMYGEVVRRGWFRKSPQTQRRAWKGFGMLLVIAGVASGWFLGFGSADTDARAGIGLGIPSGIVLAIGLVLAGLIVRFLGQRMAAKTAEGSAVLAQSLGFQKYLETAEAGQIRFEEAQDIFSRYLPYAIVFGVADRWATVFGDVAQAAQAAGRPLVMPAWYLFPAGYFGGFAGIASGMDSFSTTASGTFVSTAGSSGASGFGGGGFSGGGGFAGGGGGGGGSGSW